MSRYGQQPKSGGRFGTAGASNVTKLLQRMSMECAEEKRALDQEHKELFGAPVVMYKRRIPAANVPPSKTNAKAKVDGQNSQAKVTTETFFAHATNVGERAAPVYSRQDFEDAGLIPPGAEDVSFVSFLFLLFTNDILRFSFQVGKIIMRYIFLASCSTNRKTV